MPRRRKLSIRWPHGWPEIAASCPLISCIDAAPCPMIPRPATLCKLSIPLGMPLIWFDCTDIIDLILQSNLPIFALGRIFRKSARVGVRVGFSRTPFDDAHSPVGAPFRSRRCPKYRTGDARSLRNGLAIPPRRVSACTHATAHCVLPFLSSNGQVRHLRISLPLVACLVDGVRYFRPDDLPPPAGDDLRPWSRPRLSAHRDPALAKDGGNQRPAPHPHRRQISGATSPTSTNSSVSDAPRAQPGRPYGQSHTAGPWLGHKHHRCSLRDAWTAEYLCARAAALR